MNVLSEIVLAESIGLTVYGIESVDSSNLNVASGNVLAESKELVADSNIVNVLPESVHVESSRNCIGASTTGSINSRRQKLKRNSCLELQKLHSELKNSFERLVSQHLACDQEEQERNQRESMHRLQEEISLPKQIT